MTDNNNYGLEDNKSTVYGTDGQMTEPYSTEYKNLIDGKITIDEYSKRSEGDE